MSPRIIARADQGVPDRRQPTHEAAEWDYDLLPIELTELQDANFDLGLPGLTRTSWPSCWLPGSLEGRGNRSRRGAGAARRGDHAAGDLWILGDHRLLCGDSSKPEDVDRLLDGATIHLVNTDPPYNVKVEPRSNNAIAAGLSRSTGRRTTSRSTWPGIRRSRSRRPKKLRAKDRPLANDFVSDEEFDRLLDAWFGNIARVLEPGRGFYIWGGYANCGNYPPVPEEASGCTSAQAIIWDKQHPVLTRKDFMGNHEWCFYGWKEGAAHQFFGPEQRHRRVARQEGQPAEHGPPDREAGRAGRAGDAVLVAPRRERARPVRRQRHRR